jgi:serine/threonine protein kinase
VLQNAQRLGDFEIIRLLGRGGMGEVYEAKQFNPPRRVALKVLAPWLARDEEALARFQREAAVPAQLDHPGIVRIIVTGRTLEGLAYYTMQLVRGASLAALMRCAALPQQSTTGHPPTPGTAAPGDTPTGPERPGAAPPPADVPEAVLAEYRTDRYRFAARVGAQAARALAHAHRGGHLHRDVKPSNLMVDQAGQVYLVDFGLTRALLPGGDASAPGNVRGTPWYMSPEQARGEAIDHRSDLFSLGVTLFELATGGVGPYTASRDNTEAVLAQVKAGTVLPLRALAPDVPPELERVIGRCLHRRARHRYPDAEELAADLERFRGTEADTAVRPLPARPWLKRAGLVGALALAGGAVVVLAPAFFRGPAVPTTAPAPPARRWNVPSPLLARDFRPLHERRLGGQGGYVIRPGQGLVLESFRDAKPTLFALGETDEPCFEFATEARRFRSKGRDGAQEVGIFFGRRDGPDGPSPCFVVSVADGPAAVGQAVVQVQSWLADEGNGVRRPHFVQRPLLTPERPLTTVPLKRPDDWHLLRVQVRGRRVAIFADEHLTWEFDAASLNRPPRAAPLGPRGPFGLWCREGLAAFRNATLTALPPAEGGP